MTPPDLVTSSCHLVDSFAPDTEFLDCTDNSIFLGISEWLAPDPLIDVLLFLDNIIDLVAEFGELVSLVIGQFTGKFVASTDVLTLGFIEHDYLF